MSKINEIFSELIEKIKKNKKILIICVIFFLIVGVLVYFSYSKQPKEEVNQSSNSQADLYVHALENKIEDVIEQIDGVSNINVAITLETGFEYVYAEEKEIKDTTGGTLTTSNLILVNGSPVIIKEIFPIIQGVLVVADGVDNLTVKHKVLSAVQTVLEINNQKITILS